jgi:hypothetical protein
MVKCGVLFEVRTGFLSIIWNRHCVWFSLSLSHCVWTLCERSVTWDDSHGVCTGSRLLRCSVVETNVSGLSSRPDDGGCKLLWSAGRFVPDYTAHHKRKVILIFAAVITWILPIFLLSKLSLLEFLLSTSNRILWSYLGIYHDCNPCFIIVLITSPSHLTCTVETASLNNLTIIQSIIWLFICRGYGFHVDSWLTEVRHTHNELCGRMFSSSSAFYSGVPGFRSQPGDWFRDRLIFCCPLCF